MPLFIRLPLYIFSKIGQIGTLGDYIHFKTTVCGNSRNIYNMLQTIAANAGIDKRKAHPHALRHFFAKSFYDKTHDLVMLSNILGHSDISTTKNYVTGTFEELCNEMEEIGIL